MTPTQEGWIGNEQKIRPDCPRCGGSWTVRYGKTSGGSSRFKCRICGRTFVRSSNVAGSRFPYSIWEEFGRCMDSGMSVRKASKRCGMSVSTGYRIRRRLGYE